jgi:hypothetical protein
MIRLTVLYNLQPDVDEDEFLKWRLTDHQEANKAVPGVIRTDFARIDRGWPEGAGSPYRFMTTADWPDMESFENAFYDPAYQEALQENVKMLDNPVFLISEILIHGTKEDLL